MASDLPHDLEERVQGGRGVIRSPGGGQSDLRRRRPQYAIHDIRPLQIAHRGREKGEAKPGRDETHDQVGLVRGVDHRGRKARVDADCV